MIRPLDTWNVTSMDLDPHQAQVLRSDVEARVIAINLPAGRKLGDHQVHERAYLIVAGGEVEVEQDGRTETGGAGFVAHFKANERHEVRATSDARLLLILAPWPGAGHPSQRNS
jgi:quercetin dioxygenase-like cupin family protein